MNPSHPTLRVFGNPYRYSGYGNATRNLAKAISDSAVDAKFVFSGKDSGYSSSLAKTSRDPSVDLYIQTPPFNKHSSNNYKIGYFYWEADVLPKLWARDICKSLDEVWVPCELTKKSCLLAGFRGPIEILPTPAELPPEPSTIQIPSVYQDLALSESVFKFYSIFQWNERKGYNKLLRAYYEEFSSRDNVILIMKVNPVIHSGHGMDKINRDILKIRSLVGRNRSDLPKIFVSTDFLEKDVIHSIHHSCDAFVLPHRGEGWGMPIHDAINHKNLIITTKYGGITEWLDETNSFPISHSIVPVSKMDWNPWYSPYQKWASPSLGSLKRLMRFCFENNNNNNNLSSRRENLDKIINLFTIEKCSKDIETILSKKRFKKHI